MRHKFMKTALATLVMNTALKGLFHAVLLRIVSPRAATSFDPNCHNKTFTNDGLANHSEGPMARDSDVKFQAILPGYGGTLTQPDASFFHIDWLVMVLMPLVSPMREHV